MKKLFIFMITILFSSITHCAGLPSYGRLAPAKSVPPLQDFLTWYEKRELAKKPSEHELARRRKEYTENTEKTRLENESLYINNERNRLLKALIDEPINRAIVSLRLAEEFAYDNQSDEKINHQIKLFKALFELQVVEFLKLNSDIKEIKELISQLTKIPGNSCELKVSRAAAAASAGSGEPSAIENEFEPGAGASEATPVAAVV